jgi:hypothetical protein
MRWGPQSSHDARLALWLAPMGAEPADVIDNATSVRAVVGKVSGFCQVPRECQQVLPLDVSSSATTGGHAGSRALVSLGARRARQHRTYSWHLLRPRSATSLAPAPPGLRPTSSP